MWIIMACLSAIFAGLTAILAKCGIRKTDADLATAIRTIVVLLFAWTMVFVVGSADTITTIAPKSLLFLLLSGAATGASWICYFKALSVGDVNKVVPIDKSSTILTVLLAMILFGETEHLAVKIIGVAMLTVGIFMMIEKKGCEAYPQKRELDYLRSFFCHICGIDIRSCKNRDHRCGIKSRHSYKNRSRSYHGMGDCVCERKTERA